MSLLLILQPEFPVLMFMYNNICFTGKERTWQSDLRFLFCPILFTLSVSGEAVLTNLLKENSSLEHISYVYIQMFVMRLLLILIIRCICYFCDKSGWGLTSSLLLAPKHKGNIKGFFLLSCYFPATLLIKINIVLITYCSTKEDSRDSAR